LVSFTFATPQSYTHAKKGGYKVKYSAFFEGVWLFFDFLIGRQFFGHGVFHWPDASWFFSFIPR